MSSEMFTALDHYLWKLTYKWAKHSHPNKPKHWIVNRYFGRFNKSRQDRWVFGDRDSGAYLHQARLDEDRPTPDGQGGTASPDDPALAEYWAERRREQHPHRWTTLSLRLLQSQHGRCPLCGDLLLHADHPPQSPREWEQWVRTTGKALAKRAMAYQERGTSDDGSDLRLIHARCRRRTTARDSDSRPLQCLRAFGLA